jgi:hypothetical protein
MVHGDADDFAPIEAARALTTVGCSRRSVRFRAIPGGDHFLNDGPVEPLLAHMEACIPRPRSPIIPSLIRWLGLDRRRAAPDLSAA